MRGLFEDQRWVGVRGRSVREDGRSLFFKNSQGRLPFKKFFVKMAFNMRVLLQSVFKNQF